jgi:hypothetical protein
MFSLSVRFGDHSRLTALVFSRRSPTSGLFRKPNFNIPDPICDPSLTGFVYFHFPKGKSLKTRFS